MPKVLIADKMSDQAAEIMRVRGLAVDVKTGLTEDELVNIATDYDAIAVRSTTKITARILAAAKNLKVVGRAGIGVDNVDVPAATAQGVVVMNTPHGNAVTTAEHTLAMLFASARQIPEADKSTQAGKWEKTRFIGTELFGKTLGIIGCGNIGAIVADRALGLKLKVISYDPFLSEERARELGVEKVTLDELLPRADFITLHVPLNEQTQNILNANTLAKCKRGARVINCARGGLVDEQALKDALDSGQVAGAAFDVFVTEPAKENILFGTPNFIATPHLGASTAEAQENVAVQLADQLADFLLAGAVANAVNAPALSAEDRQRMQPYLKLAEFIGHFLGQLVQGDISAIDVKYVGELAQLKQKPLTASAMQALLSHQLDRVNIVNALAVAADRKIAVTETRAAVDGNYRSFMRVTVMHADGTTTVTGTLSDNGTPRLIEIDNIAIEATHAPQILFVRNQDKPGMVAAMGQVLATAKVNIASFSLGRNAVGGEAMAIIAVDQPVSSPVLQTLQALPDMLAVYHLTFH